MINGPIHLQTSLVYRFPCGLILLLSLLASANADESKEIIEQNNGVINGAQAQETHKKSTLTITADPYSPSLLDYGNPVSILDKQQIISKSETTIGETLANEPGVTSSYFGPGSSRPVIRGNSGQRIRMLKNGIGSLDLSNISEDHAVSVNPLSAESIEILRGPETLLFGNSAIGGVVNVIDNSIPEVAIGKSVTAAADLRQGTANNELTGAAKLEGQIKTFNWHLDYFNQDTDNISIPSSAESNALHEKEAEANESHDEAPSSGKLLNSATMSNGITFGSSLVSKKGFIGASINGWNSKYGVPGHQHSETQNDAEDMSQGVAIDAHQVRLNMRGRLNQPNDILKRINFKLGASAYEHTELENGNTGTKLSNNSLEGRLEVAHTRFNGLDGILGLQILASDFSASGEEAFLPDSTTLSPAMFFFEDIPLTNRLKLKTGMRYEFVNYDADGFSSKTYHPFSYSAGIVLDPKGDSSYTLGLTGAYTQRAPAFTELYADGAHVARQIVEHGNPNLPKENVFGLDFTAKKNTGIVTSVINLFLQNYGDYINLSATGDSSEGLPVFNYKAIEAVFWGFELDGVFHVHELLDIWSHDLELKAQLDYTRGENKTDDDSLPRIPPLRTIIGLDYGYKQLFKAYLKGIFVASQNNTANFELPTDAYQLLNAGGNVKLFVDDNFELAFYIKGTNLTNSEARVHSSFIKDIAPLRGRNLLFGLRGVF